MRYWYLTVLVVFTALLLVGSVPSTTLARGGGHGGGQFSFGSFSGGHSSGGSHSTIGHSSFLHSSTPHSSGSTGGHSGSIQVHGYAKKDGTHVTPYTRSASHEHIPTTPSAGEMKGWNGAHLPTSKPYAPRASLGVERDRHGRIERSTKARDAFMQSHPCPSTGKTSGSCSGYVVDHIKALKHGGLDDPSNMEWQTTEEAKANDKWE
jgi:hypothetical protein